MGEIHSLGPITNATKGDYNKGPDDTGTKAIGSSSQIPMPPVINPPVNPDRIPRVSSDLNKWEELVEKYYRAAEPWIESHKTEIDDLKNQAEMLQFTDPSYMEKYSNLIAKHNKLIEGLRRSPENKALLKEADRLFNRAFKYDPKKCDLMIDNNAKQDLDAFIELTAQAGNDDPVLIELARRANPDLDQDEHKLIYLYQSAKTNNSRLAALKKITDQFKILAKNEIEGYDGWVSTSRSPALKRIYAFWWALTSVIIDEDSENVDQYLAGYNLEISKDYIKTFDELRGDLAGSDDRKEKKRQILNDLEQYLVARPETIKESLLANKEILLDIIEDSSCLLSKAPLGEDKIQAYRFNRVLSDIALVVGITDKEIGLRILTSSLPKYEGIEDHYQCLTDISNAKESPERVDNYTNSKNLMDMIMEVYLETLNARGKYTADPTPGKQQRYSSLELLLGQYISFASDFGISKEELEEDLIQNAPVREKPATLDEARMKGIVIVAPNALPSGLQKMLKDTEVPKDIKHYLGKSGKYTYFDMVKDNVRTINLVHGIKESDTLLNTVGQEGGHAVPCLKNIWIDVDGLPDWFLAEVIIHETDHVITFWKYYDQPEYQRSTPTERHAYLTGARFLENYIENNQSKLNREEKYRMAQTILSDYETGLAANPPLKLDTGDPTLEMTVPDRAEERDLDTYPTNLSASYKEEMDKLFGVLEKEEGAKSSTREIYENILEGNIKIEGSINGKVWLISKNGIKEEAPKDSSIWVPIQSLFGLKADGRLGPHTLAKLQEIYNQARSMTKPGYFEFSSQELQIILTELGVQMILQYLER